MQRLLTEMVIRTNYESELCKAKLEVEENGRELASLQGRISGYKRFMGFLAAEFGLSQTMIEPTGQEPQKVADMEPGEFDHLALELSNIKAWAQWERVLSRIDESTEELKTTLLFSAEKTRELDLYQGVYKSTIEYQNFFREIEAEAERREEKARKDREEPGLF